MAMTKEAFFRDLLIPAGQLSEIILEISHMRASEKENITLSNTLFGMLNLTACYMANPKTKVMGGIPAIIQDLNSELLKILESMGPSRASYILEGFRIPNRNTSVEVRRKFSEALKGFISKKLEIFQAALYREMQYSPASHDKWVQDIVSNDLPLTKGSRLNRWRTFVRNTSWERTATMAGIRDKLAVHQGLSDNHFSSAVGREQADILWKQVFDINGVDVERNDGLKALPPKMHVEATADRLLQVSIHIDPISMLTPEDAIVIRGQKKKPGLPADFEAALAKRSFIRITDVAGLAQVVAEGEKWMAEQDSSPTQLKQLLDTVLMDQKKAALRAKLESSFSEEDRALLRDLLAEDSPGKNPNRK